MTLMGLPKAIQYTTLLGIYYYTCRFKGLSVQKGQAILDADCVNILFFLQWKISWN